MEGIFSFRSNWSDDLHNSWAILHLHSCHRYV